MFILTDPEGPLSYIFIFLMIIVAAFFAGSEVSYAQCNQYKIKVWADDGNKRAKLALKILDKFDNLIIAILIVTNIIHVTISVIATIMANKLIGEAGTIYSTIIVTILVFTFSEIIPKNIAKANSDKWAINSSFVLYFNIIIFYPLVLFFSGLLKLIMKLFKSKEDLDAFTDDDFQDVVDKISHEGVIDEEESEIIIAAVDFGETVVGEVLTKRDNIIAIDIKNLNNEYLKSYLNEHTYSRIPVYEGSIDNIVGILHVRTYLKELWKNRNIDPKSCLMKPYIVSPRVKLDEMFEGFKQHKTHIAIVRDKKKTIGMVTMKDVLEELVNDIEETSFNEGDTNE